MREGSAVGTPASLNSEEAFIELNPLLSPQLLQQYPETVALQLLAIAEKEQAQRHDRQMQALAANFLIQQKRQGDRRLGQVLGFSLAVLAVLAGALMAIFGEKMTGAIAGGVMGLAGTISLYALQHRIFPPGERSEIPLDQPK